MAGIAVLLETDLIDDTARDLTRAALMVRLRYGPEFRALEAQLKALDGASHCKGFEPVEDGRFVVIPPHEWTAALKEAKRLGVI